MLREFLVKTSIFSFIVFLAIGFSSCGNIASEAKSVYVAPIVNQDSIDAVLKEIDAVTKTKKLEEIYQKRIQFGFNGCVLIAQRGQVLYKKPSVTPVLKQSSLYKLILPFSLPLPPSHLLPLPF